MFVRTTEYNVVVHFSVSATIFIFVQKKDILPIYC